ncbi:MAG: ABC transporter permease [Chloroflexi bacterium]|nr:ABC transporter permease [Chloroflexota bacterium]
MAAGEQGLIIPTAGRRRAGLLGVVVRFVSDPKAAVATALLGFFIVVAIFAPVIAPYGEDQHDKTASLVQPSRQHFLGTDRLGRDIFSRIIYGARVSVRIGLISVGVAAAVGIPIGLVSGYAGGWIDETIMRFVDAWIAFPNLIFLLFVIAILGPGVTNVMVAIGLNSFPIYSRLIRASTLSLREREYVMAARSTGASSGRILQRHILPNAVQPIIVQASLALGSAVLAESGLSFLGIGIKPPTATWGVIIADGFALIRVNPWISIAPGVAIVLFVLSVNLMGDRLRDVMDPRLRGAR